MRLMAIDYGGKRVGVASTDETGHFAIPRFVLPNDRDLIKNILKFKDENGIGKIIIGESKNFQGKANVIQEEIEKFANELKKALSTSTIVGDKEIPEKTEVVFHPEILTTVEARRLQGNIPLTDASAASLILKSYIDTVYNKDI